MQLEKAKSYVIPAHPNPLVGSRQFHSLLPEEGKRADTEVRPYKRVDVNVRMSLGHLQVSGQDIADRRRVFFYAVESGHIGEVVFGVGVDAEGGENGGEEVFFVE